MEGWRKRIGRIASSFEAANKDAIQQAAPVAARPPARAQERPSHSAGCSRRAQQQQWQQQQGFKNLRGNVSPPPPFPSSSHSAYIFASACSWAVGGDTPAV